ncbi:hypothetical protein AVEN_93666-1 [Araneus ventricosus]|uniref:Uncharacterized protein n=1 Tax=Araneus ventricosus TaxID=182803 RepID=A0A4Y2SBP4_ARAVE|nr:hypothetical protein AVEN_93666-1 [Araneus ventricosus]
MKGGTSSECEEGLWSFVCSTSWKAGELSANIGAFTVIISDLLTVCVARSESAVTVITCEVLSVALLICARSIVPVTCATCFPEYLGIKRHSSLSRLLDCF